MQSKGAARRIPALMIAGLLLITITASTPLTGQENVNWKKVSVLVYTKNGKGYVHENIPYAVACLKKLGAAHGFRVDATEDASAFTADNLKQYSVILFASTNNDVFDTDEQRLAFRRYIEAGGGFVGIHSVVGTERNWKWFKALAGGSFVWHPKFQRYRIVNLDPTHPSLEGLPRVWEKEDECYFQKEMNPAIHTIMAHDLTSLTSLDGNDNEKVAAHAGPYTELYPAVWHHRFDGGYVWITALGHHKKDYEDPLFVRHILNGIAFVAGQVKKPEPEKAYAMVKDEPVR